MALSRLKTVRFVSPQKADNHSYTMLPTAAPSNDTLNQLQSTFQDMQYTKKENQKLRADFAAYPEATARQPCPSN